MPLIDDRGRLFGKVNLIDAAVGIFVLLLVPLAYGAFLLFRMPAPTITSLQPATVMEHTPAVVAVAGGNLRPFLRARVGGFEAQFLVQSPTVAEIKLPGIPAGTYDLSLFDEANRVLFRPGALTVQPAAIAPSAARLDLQAVGAFVGLSKEAAALIGMDSKFQPPGGAAGATPVAEVLALRAPEPAIGRVKIGPAVFATALLPELSVPAIIRVICAVGDGVCTFGGTAVSQGATITLPFSPPKANSGHPGPEQVRFTIDQLFPAGSRPAFPSVVTARVRFVGGPEVLSAMKIGDVDVGLAATEPTRVLVFGANRAVLIAVGSETQTMNGLVSSEAVLGRGLQLQQSMATFICIVRIPVVYTPLGWSYHERLVKVGAPFFFESTSAAMSGWILDLKMVPEGVAAAQ